MRREPRHDRRRRRRRDDASRRAQRRASPPIDCFYVYPTVSPRTDGNSDLKIELAETLVAQLAGVVVLAGLPRLRADLPAGHRPRARRPVLHASPLEAYGDVLAAWRDYLAHDNHGRGVVLIGHSQGAYVLKRLSDGDRPSARASGACSCRRSCSAARCSPGTRGRWGDFTHVPPARRRPRRAAWSPTRPSTSTPPPNARSGAIERARHTSSASTRPRPAGGHGTDHAALPGERLTAAGRSRSRST